MKMTFASTKDLTILKSSTLTKQIHSDSYVIPPSYSYIYLWRNLQDSTHPYANLHATHMKEIPTKTQLTQPNPIQRTWLWASFLIEILRVRWGSRKNMKRRTAVYA